MRMRRARPCRHLAPLRIEPLAAISTGGIWFVQTHVNLPGSRAQAMTAPHMACAISPILPPAAMLAGTPTSGYRSRRWLPAPRASNGAPATHGREEHDAEARRVARADSARCRAAPPSALAGALDHRRRGMFDRHRRRGRVARGA